MSSLHLTGTEYAGMFTPFWLWNSITSYIGTVTGWPETMAIQASICVEKLCHVADDDVTGHGHSGLDGLHIRIVGDADPLSHACPDVGPELKSMDNSFPNFCLCFALALFPSAMEKNILGGDQVQIFLVYCDVLDRREWLWRCGNRCGWLFHALSIVQFQVLL